MIAMSESQLFLDFLSNSAIDTCVRLLLIIFSYQIVEFKKIQQVFQFILANTDYRTTRYAVFAQTFTVVKEHNT